MSTKRAIEIGKKVILLAGVKGKLAESEKKNIQNGLEKYKVELQKSRSSYAKRVVEFIDDLLDDIAQGRELNLDSLNHDEFIENYFEVENDLALYNSLIDEEIYKKLILSLQDKNPKKKTIQQGILQLEKNFLQQFKKLSGDSIAKNLLIFSLFDIKKPQKALKNLYYLGEYYGLDEVQLKCKKMFTLIEELKSQIKLQGIQYFNSKSFRVKYMKFSRDSREITSEVLDASIEGFRSGNALYEYKKCLVRL